MVKNNEVKVGDTVLYKDEVGGGVITQLSKDMAYVEEETGFGDWFSLKELIVKEDISIDTPSASQVEMKEGGNKLASKPHSKNHISKLEVDLHLDAFLDHTRGLTNYEKVTLQMAEAKKALAKAKGQKYKYLHLIHGKGSGKLRQELHEWLNHQNVVDYYDMDISGNRSGVTEVRLF